MRVKKAAAYLSMAIAAVSMAGCSAKTAAPSESGSVEGSQTGGTVTLRIWAPQEDQSPSEAYPNGIVPYLCEKFNEENPAWDITFKYGVMPEFDASTSVAKDLDTAADVFMYANDHIPVMVDSGTIARLGGAAVEEMKANVSTAMVGTVSYNEGIYGFPYTPNTYFMFYDKSKYSEEDVKSLDTMMEKDLGQGVSNFSYKIGDSWYITSFFYAAGGELFGPNGDDNEGGSTFGNHPEVTEYLIDLANNPKFFREENNASLAKFKDGTLGAYVSGSWDAAAIQEALGDNFGVTKLPVITLKGKPCQMYSFVGSKAVGVNPASKNIQVSVALASYLAGEEAQKVRFEVRGFTPIWKSVTELDTVKSNPVAAAQILQINEASKTQPLVKNIKDYWSPAEALGKSILQGDTTKENAVEATTKMGNGINSAGL